ncbi:predicted protein [Pyrenophora tritici-repentis Pt-1C-BFP]|uniref:SnoaL-like domain-containing protein n=1 Tax=Pyrenophora tritici-repentis (strain Pt-1C-BFP) TaxID=426418 RepID=B2W227_PYRTR|nr:uncharacterized protein PTRG_03475 [Pyrenophora tritici-repentis Pt-1C-BFP]EDU46313.1 predicted protein [Pyrenophora tritici-repentis Pt-1C-BFP]
MSTLAAQKATTQAVIDAYNAWDIEKILAVRAPDCTTRVLPASMGRPNMSNSEYRERMNQLTIHEEVHDADAHKCMMHLSSTSETDIGPYTNEYALILHLTDDGKQVIKFLEFVDSAYSTKFFAALAEAGLGK